MTYQIIERENYDALRAEITQLRAVLLEAQLQIEYLHRKFKPTGTGEATLARIRSVLSNDNTQ